MRSDFSNLTFHPSLGRSRVLQQQGQLVTDAQANEQTGIVLHVLRTLTRDLLGGHGGPDGAAAFALQVVTTAAQLSKLRADLGLAADPPLPPELEPQLQEFGGSLPLLLPGRYYAEGLLVESSQLVSLWHQPFGELEPPRGRQLLVLDAWEQQVSAVDQPDIRDSAFAPARSADRAVIAWRVRALDGAGGPPIPETAGPDQGWWTPRLSALQGQPGERGLLRAGTHPPPPDDAPCLADPESGYRGETGQLIRLEVHAAGGPGTATVKWSFDNASVQADWTAVIDEHTLRFDPSGLVGGFSQGAWVELGGLQDDLDGTSGLLIEVSGVDDDELQVTGLSAGTSLQALHDRLTAQGRRASVRLWDQRPEAGSAAWMNGALILEEGQDIDLGQGVQVQFAPVSPGAAGAPRRYRTGDYWLILARPNRVQALRGERSQLFPDGSVSPFGPNHVYAPLALVDVTDSHVLSVVADHRRRFEPVASLSF